MTLKSNTQTPTHANQNSYFTSACYHCVSAQTFYHGTTLDRAKSILNQGPKGKAFYVTPSPRIAEHFAKKSQPWLGSQEQRTIAILELIPKTQTLTLAEPNLSIPFQSHVAVAQYPDNSHYEKADLGWNSEHRYQFLTQKGCQKFDMRLTTQNLKEPKCFQLNFLQSCFK